MLWGCFSLVERGIQGRAERCIDGVKKWLFIEEIGKKTRGAEVKGRVKKNVFSL